jgi:uncharacterized protein
LTPVALASSGIGISHRPDAAVASDPQGVGFILFKGQGEAAPTTDPSKTGHIGWSELHAGDGAAALDFYAGLFGCGRGDAMDMGVEGITGFS